MRAEDLYRLMEEPSELTEGTLLELRRIVEDYPYFQVARMLYLKNLAVLNDMSFTSELEKMAIFLPDRKLLLHQQRHIPHRLPQCIYLQLELPCGA